MFFKVSDRPLRYVNTDNIEVINFNGKTRGGQAACILDFRSGRTIPIPDAAGRALIEFAEGNSAFIDDTPGPSVGATAEQPVTAAPLKSKIAQYLRDEAPNGAMLMDLVMKFPGKDAEVPEAINELQTEKVVMLVTDRYYHAQHAPRPAPGEPNEFLATTTQERES